MSAPVTFDTTPQMLATTATECDTTAGNLASQLATLKSYVLSLDGPWISMTATAFQGLMVDYDRCTRDLNTALTGIATGLRSNENNYSSSETTNHGSVVSIVPDLPVINL